MSIGNYGGYNSEVFNPTGSKYTPKKKKRKKPLKQRKKNWSNKRMKTKIYR